MKLMIILLITGIFGGNLITTNLLGIEALQKAKDKNLLSQLKSGLIITALIFVTSAVTYPLGRWVMSPLGLGFLTALVFMIIVCVLFFGVSFTTDRYLPKVSTFLKENCDFAAFLPIAFAVSLLNMASDVVTSYPIALLYSVMCGIGYTFVSVILFAVNDRMKTTELPSAVKGLPITLIILSLISLAFGGFAGI